MNKFPSRIYLASRSPRRRELLTQMGIRYEVLLLRDSADRQDLDETPLAAESPGDHVQRIATEKALLGWQRVIQRRLPQYPVLGADTSITLDGAIFGKPKTRENTVRMLTQLSGRTHEIMTAVAIVYREYLQHMTCKSSVTFKSLTAEEIECYANSGEPLDKAGAYAIQGRGAIFVEHLVGSYSGVMGLPIFETACLLDKLKLHGYPG
ncbi:MAG TPA: Maf family protein [Burkholderiales bacterium]|nr:Maf family protein [Burkholderiales bacterium]